MPKYYEISEEAAKRAKNANSYSDYVPGSATAGYRAMVDEAYTLGAEQKSRVDPMYHEKSTACLTAMPADWLTISMPETPLMPECRPCS